MRVPDVITTESRKRRVARRVPTRFTAALLILCGSPTVRASDGVEPIGLSMQSIARGGTDVAVGDSALSQVENPSTLMLSPQGQWCVEANGELLMPRLRWMGPRDAAYSSDRHIPLGGAGLVFPWGSKWRTGLAVYSKSHIASTYTMRTLAFPFINRRIETDLRDFALAADAAYQVTDKLSLGAGLRGEMLTGRFSSVSGPATLDFGRGYAYGAGLQLGALYQILPKLQAGVGYRSPTWFQELMGNNSRSSLAGNWEGSLGTSRSIYLGKASVQDIRLPQKISAGLCWDATDRLRLAGEARWIDYSDTVLHEADFRVAGFRNLRVRSPLGYQDQYVLATGAEYRLGRHWKLSGGYHYASNPISHTEVVPAVAMIPQHHLTAGIRYEREHWWIGAGYVVGLPTAYRSGWCTRVPFGTDYLRVRIEQMEQSVMCGFGLRW